MAKTVIGIVTVTAAAAAVFGFWRLRDQKAEAASPGTPVAAVRTADLRLTVSAEGKLKPKQYITVKPKIKTVEWITLTKLVPNGTIVKPGDLLCAFDSTSLEDSISKLTVDVQSAESGLVQAQEELRKAELDRKLNIRDKEFKLMLAEKQYAKYKEFEGPKLVKESENARSRAGAVLEEAKEDYAEALEMKREDLIAENDVKKAEFALRDAEYALESAKLSHDLLVKYTIPLETQRLKQTHEDAKEQMESIKPYTDSIVAQKQTAVTKAERALMETRTWLEKKQKDLANCEIRSEASGMIHYGSGEGHHRRHSSDRDTLKVGNNVRNYDQLMYIPDLSQMYLGVLVDEVDVSKIRKGQRITAYAEAHPEITLNGVVEDVSQVASRQEWWSTEMKFRVRCSLEQSLEWFRPDLTARVEIEINELKGVTIIPLDAVFQHEGKTVCFLEDGTIRPVTLGSSTSQAVQVKEGLQPGNHVRLTRPAVP